MLGKNQDRTNRSDAALRCSFCQKTADQVRKLIAGPAVFICNECVDVCNQIIADDKRMTARLKAEAEVSARVESGNASRQVSDIPVSGDAIRCSLCGMPTLLEDGTAVPNRAWLCPGCVDAIQASIAARDLQS
jgi:ClpX C4-type zinc finger protein